MSDDPMGLVREEIDMGKIDREDRIAAVKRLPDVATVMGAEETRSALIPFLVGKINQVAGSLEEDEVMLAMAEVLGNMVTEVGGGAHATSLIEPLVALASVEETLVRDMASIAMSKVVDQISVTEPNARVAFDGLLKMHQHEWFFARVSACGVAASVYKLCKSAMPASDTTIITELREIYQQYAADETPMVRRSAAEHLGAYATSVDDEKLFNEHVLPMLQTVSQDEQDSVRVLAIKQIPAILKLLGPLEETNQAAEHEEVLKLIKGAAQDVSWRVRDATSKCFPDFTRVYGRVPKKADELTNLVKLFANLLCDPEAEVRLSAVKSILEVATGCGPVSFHEHALPSVNQVCLPRILVFDAVSRVSVNRRCLTTSSLPIRPGDW
jgi:serine/threonine-protein phosphatase 2A regulatory subunit A